MNLPYSWVDKAFVWRFGVSAFTLGYRASGIQIISHHQIFMIDNKVHNVLLSWLNVVNRLSCFSADK